MRPRQMNPRQRQGLLLVIIAAAGLLGVFLLIANYVSTVSKQVGPKVNVLVLAAPLAPYQPLSSSMLQELSVPAKWAPRGAITDPGEVSGLVSGISLPAGTELQSGMLEQPPALQPGEREIAILVDAETGIAGQISPGSLVDIVATFQGGNSSKALSSARVIVPSAKILNVGTPQVSGGSSTGSSQALDQNQVVPVTLALTPQQVLEVSYAESFAQKVRLSLVAPGSSTRPVHPAPYAPGL